MSGHPSGEAAEQRVWGAVPAGTRNALEATLAPTDLQTLLLAVARARARRVTPSRVLQRWRQDRFFRPSACDPRLLAQLESRIWQLLPHRFTGVELSPVAPLGTCSALATVDQHRVVSTVRGSEVVSDPTNVLAVEAAIRRREQDVGGRVDLAACHRVLRAQRFGPGNAAHFRLFALASTARDRGSGSTEAHMLIDHIGFWRRVLSDVLPTSAPADISVTIFRNPILAERLRDTIRPALDGSGASVPVVEDPTRRQGDGYYTGAALGVFVDMNGQRVDIGDGGLTTWTAQLLGDAKERCLVSCIATERLTMLARQPG